MMGDATSPAFIISLLPGPCAIVTGIMAEVSERLILGCAHQIRAMIPHWAVKRSLLAYGIQGADKAMLEIFGFQTPVSLKFHSKLEL